jgi:hypothetical protein
MGSSVTSIAATNLIQMLTSTTPPSLATLMEKIENLQALATKSKRTFTSLKKMIPKQVITMLTKLKREVHTIEEEKEANILTLLNYIDQVKSTLELLENDYEIFNGTADSHFETSNIEKEVEDNRIRKQEVENNRFRKQEETVKAKKNRYTEEKKHIQIEN